MFRETKERIAEQCHTDVSEMLHSEKPRDVRFLIHSIRTTNKLSKYDSNSDTTKNITSGKTERIINLFMT